MKPFSSLVLALIPTLDLQIHFSHFGEANPHLHGEILDHCWNRKRHINEHIDIKPPQYCINNTIRCSTSNYECQIPSYSPNNPRDTAFCQLVAHFLKWVVAAKYAHRHRLMLQRFWLVVEFRGVQTILASLSNDTTYIPYFSRLRNTWQYLAMIASSVAA